MLLKGLRMEGEEDFDSAISCYTRAGMHSKDPHVSKMLIGNLHYKNGKLMLALNFYTQAVHLLSKRFGSTRLISDEFIAYRNRAVISFRLGDDRGGLHDIHRAMELMPQDVELRDLASLAKRRMGKYSQAIQEATVAKTIRNEKRREELLLEKQKEYARRRKILKAEKEHRNTRPKSGGAMVYSESSKFIQFANRSSRHASVSARPRLTTTTAAAAAETTASTIEDGIMPSVSEKFSSTYTDNWLKDDDINARLQQTRGYVLNIDEPKCYNSLRDRVIESRKHVKADTDSEQPSSEDTFLRVFKMNNGCKADLFQDIFARPSELQEALLIPPEQRNKKHLEIIGTTLKLFPVLMGLSNSKVRDLAKVLEYRALSAKDAIFSQNEWASAVCLLVSGSVQVRMEKQSAGHSTIDIIIGEMPVHSVFGHIDFLFRNNNPRIMQEVEKIIRPRKVLRRATLQANSSSGGSAVGVPSGVAGTGNGSGILPGSSAAGAGGVSHSVGCIDEGDECDDAESSVGGEYCGPPMLSMSNRAHIDRSLAPGMFKTYAIQGMCELLMLRESDFEKVLLEPTLDDLKRRLDAIRSCGIFNKWTAPQHVRLARMGQIKRYKKGEILLKQGSKPNYLYIMLKGICIVQKQPNRTEMLKQKLTIAKEKAKIFDSNYLFDHKLCETLKMANLKEEFKTANIDIPEVAYTIADAKKNPDSILRSSHVTVSELERYKIQLEINKLEGLIHSAALEDAKEQANDYMGSSTAAGGGGAGGGWGTSSSSKKHFSNTNNTTTTTGTATNQHTTSSTQNIPVLELKVADIATIQWPKIFGEACLIDPADGCSRGSIVADTACEVFLLHKTQIQTFPVDDSFLSGVKSKYMCMIIVTTTVL